MNLNDFVQIVFNCLLCIIFLLLCICAIGMLIHLNIIVFTEWF